MKKRKFFKVITTMALVCIISFVVLGVVPVYAAENVIIFSGWSKYRDAIRFTLDSGTESYHVEDNLVTVDNNVTYIKQDVRLFEPSHSGFYGHVDSVTISVPADALALKDYIPSIYTGKDYTFSIVTKLNWGFCLAYDYNVSGHNGVLYVNEDTKNVIYCKHVISTVTEFNDDGHIIVRSTYKVNFPSDTFISGFWFKLNLNLKYEDRYVESGNMPLFRLETWMSPIYLSDTVTPDQLQSSVAGGILDGTGGNKYNPPDTSASEDLHAKEEAMMSQVDDLFKQSNIPFNLDLNSYPQLKNTMLGFSSAFEQIFAGLPFVKPLIMFSLGLGAFGFLFGLAQHGFTTNARVDAARARRNKGKGD